MRRAFISSVHPSQSPFRTFRTYENVCGVAYSASHGNCRSCALLLSNHTQADLVLRPSSCRLPLRAGAMTKAESAGWATGNRRAERRWKAARMQLAHGAGCPWAYACLLGLGSSSVACWPHIGLCCFCGCAPAAAPVICLELRPKWEVASLLTQHLTECSLFLYWHWRCAVALGSGVFLEGLYYATA